MILDDPALRLADAAKELHKMVLPEAGNIF